MPESPATPDPSLPRRVAWFAPWRWKPWTRWVMFGVMLVAYIEALVPFAVFVRWYDISPHPAVMQPLEIVFWPVNWGYINVPAVEQFYDAQVRPGGPVQSGRHPAPVAAFPAQSGVRRDKLPWSRRCCCGHRRSR